jgi:hypothetical protein
MVPHDRDALLGGTGLDPAREVVALVPGSRRFEIERILPPLLRSAEIVQSRRNEVQFVVPLAGTVPRALVEARIRSAGLSDTVIHGAGFPEILGACQAGAVASGTASLEAALVGLPMVVVYRVSCVPKRWPVISSATWSRRSVPRPSGKTSRMSAEGSASPGPSIVPPMPSSPRSVRDVTNPRRQAKLRRLLESLTP